MLEKRVLVTVGTFAPIMILCSSFPLWTFLLLTFGSSKISLSATFGMSFVLYRHVLDECILPWADCQGLILLLVLGEELFLQEGNR